MLPRITSLTGPPFHLSSRTQYLLSYVFTGFFYPGKLVVPNVVSPRIFDPPEPIPSQVWDPQSWTTERTLSDHTGPVRCFAQCADRLLSGSDDGSVKVYTSVLLYLPCNSSIQHLLYNSNTYRCCTTVAYCTTVCIQ